MVWHSYRRFVLLLFFSLGSFLLHAPPALACDCGAPSDVLDFFEHSDVVIVGRVSSIEKALTDSSQVQYAGGIRTATVVAEKVFRGNVKVGEELVFGQSGGSYCTLSFSEKSVGQEYLLYVDLPGKVDLDFLDPKLWYAGMCGRSTNLENATEDLLYLENMEKLRGKTRISGSLSGGRTHPDAGVDGKTIRIIGPEKTYVTTTDRNGVFEIYDLPAGNYFIEPETFPGWKINRTSLAFSRSIVGQAAEGPLRQIQIELKPKKHASLRVFLTPENVVSGNVIGPDGKPMNGVCVYLISREDDRDASSVCTDKDGRFEMRSVPSGTYVLLANKNGRLSDREPFPTLYYPNVSEREKAALITVSPGAKVIDLTLVVPHVEELVTIEGLLQYSNGKPAEREIVLFHAPDSKTIDGSVGEVTDAAGRFSIRVLKGLVGKLSAEEYLYVGKYENCRELDSWIRKTSSDFATIQTNVINLRADKNMFEVVLKFPFPGCQKKPPPR